MVAQQTISVGDNVCFTLGTTSIRGVVIDDRGPIGANNTRIFRVRFPNDPYDENVIEMPEDELALSTVSEEPISHEEIVNYLAYGGLVQILNSNTSGGKHRPAIWLVRDTLGNVVHTFVASRAGIGGATIPFRAVHDNRIWLPKLVEVQQLLSAFGLSTEEAAQVVKIVGTSP